MNDRKQKFRIGAFVIGGILLLLVMLFFFGMSGMFANKVKLKTYFSESVQGLNVGSGVKYRGVSIGTVSNISIRVSDKLVEVTLEVEPEHFAGTQSSRSYQRSEFRRFIRSEIQNGMRCRLEYTGITGMRYIDLDYFATPEEELPTPPESTDTTKDLIIPSVPSSFRDILNALSISLERISRIRFEEISNGLEHGLAELTELLSDPAIKSTLNRINEAAEHLETSTRTIARVLNEEQLNRITKLLETDLQKMDNLISELVDQVKLADIPESLATVRDTADSLIDSQDELANTLLKINQTLDSLRELSDYLNKDPSALITGKKKPTLMK